MTLISADARGYPRMPADAPPIDVTDSRAEPGHTRLSKDDVSIHKANSLKLIRLRGFSIPYINDPSMHVFILQV